MEKNEEVLKAFLQGWIDEDYEKMFEHSQLTWKQGRNVKQLQTLFSFLQLKSFKVISTGTISSVARRFTTELTLDEGTKVVSVINVICEAEPYKPRTYGTWGVNSISVQNVVQQEKPVAKPAKTDTVKTAPAPKTTAKKKSTKKKNE
jgi:hypothetical protein